MWSHASLLTSKQTLLIQKFKNPLSDALIARVIGMSSILLKVQPLRATRSIHTILKVEM